MRCEPSDSSHRYGRGEQRARCGFSGETHTGPACAGALRRFDSLIWNAFVPADAAPDARGDYKRVGNGTSYTLKAPETPGDCEVRYLLKASGQAIARAAIRVE